MNIKKIKELVKLSYKNNILDEKRVKEIADILTRSELKQFINEIKNKEIKKNVIITLPYYPSIDEQKKIQTLFMDKEITYIIDPSLVVGMKVVDNDLVSELSLKDTLESLIKHEIESYD